MKKAMSDNSFAPRKGKPSVEPGPPPLKRQATAALSAFYQANKAYPIPPHEDHEIIPVDAGTRTWKDLSEEVKKERAEVICHSYIRDGNEEKMYVTHVHIDNAYVRTGVDGKFVVEKDNVITSTPDAHGKTHRKLLEAFGADLQDGARNTMRVLKGRHLDLGKGGGDGGRDY
jgi:hypothetical protein